jgi:UDP-glucose 4-epimerase
VTQLLNGEAITIHGDGHQTRDFIYVADVIQAIQCALASNVGGEVLQVATGRETSILDCLQQTERAIGRMAKIDWAPQLPGEVRRNCASFDRAARLLGFHPCWDLFSGLVETVNWFGSAHAG